MKLSLIIVLLASVAYSFECEKEIMNLSKDVFESYYSKDKYEASVQELQSCIKKSSPLSVKAKEKIASIISFNFEKIYSKADTYHRLASGDMRASEMERDAYMQDAKEESEDISKGMIAQIEQLHATSKEDIKITTTDRETGKKVSRTNSREPAISDSKPIQTKLE